MRIVTLKEEEFNDYATRHKYESYHQTSTNANFEKTNGYDVHYLGFTNSDDNLLGATMVIYKTLFWGYKYAYAPRGFLIDYVDMYTINDITNSLKKLLYKQNFIFIKIDPLIIASERDENGKIIYFSNTVNNILNSLLKNDYEHLGFNLYDETVLPRWNVFAKLDPNTKNLFNSFSNERKENIKTANRMAVSFYQDETNDINNFCDFIKKCGNKRRKSYFTNLHNAYMNSGKLKIFYAKIDTNQYAKNTSDLYNNELEKNKGLANIIENQNGKKYDMQKVINDKMESDKIINIYKKDIILSTELLRKFPEGILCGTAVVIEQSKGVNLILNYQLKEYEKFNIMPLMIHEIMKYYSKLNYKFINLGPVSGVFDPSSEHYPLLKSKIGYNSSIIEYIGEFNLIVNPLMYRIYKRKEKKKKKKKN